MHGVRRSRQFIGGARVVVLEPGCELVGSGEDVIDWTGHTSKVERPTGKGTMDALRITAAPPGVYRLRGASPTVYYLDLRHPNSPLFLRIPSRGSNTMDFDWRWQDLHRLTSYTLEGATEGVARLGAVHKFERSPGPWDTPWVRATALQSIERLDGGEEDRLLAEFPQSRAADQGDRVPHVVDRVSTADVHREALLTTPALDLEELARIRGTTADDVESWAQRHAERLLTVTHAGRTLFPVFQFTETGELHARIGQVNALLKADPNMDEWSRWAWWHSRTSFLSGASPLDIVESDYARVLRAARRMTRRHAAADDPRVLNEQRPGNELVERTATQPAALSPKERRDLFERIVDEMATDWRDVFDRLGREGDPEEQ